MSASSLGFRHSSSSFAALMVGAVAIGFAPIFVRLSEVGPSATAFWRLALAAPVLWTWSFLAPSKESAGMSRRDAWQLFAVGALFAGDLAVWHWSIHWTSVANATLLANFAPIYTVALGWLIWRRKVSAGFLLSLAAALAGATLLLGSRETHQAHAALGDAAGLLTAAFYAGYLTMVAVCRRRYSAIEVMAWSSLPSVILLGAIAWQTEPVIAPASARGWAIAAGLALVSHVGGQGLIAFSLARLPPALVSVGLLIQPVAATIAAAFWLGEGFNAWQTAGMAMVLSGVFVARREERR